MQRTMRGALRLTGSLTVLLALACASAADRFEEGLALESSGEPYEAALRYIDALDKDPSLSSARQRLQEAGSLALTHTLADAERLHESSRAIDAGREVLTGEALIDASSAVGVHLARPAGFEVRASTLRDEATSALLTAAASSRRSGNFGDARESLHEARLRMAPDSRVREVEGAEAAMLLEWAEASFEDGRHRAAFDRADEALQFADHTGVEARALRIQTLAVEAGTVFVAVLPSTLSPAVDGAPGLEASFTRALDDGLELDHFPNAPLFVAVVPPAETRRSLRIATQRDTPEDAAITLLLTDLDAQLAAVVEVTQVDLEKRNVDVDAVDIRIEGGGTAATRLERGRLEYSVAAEVELLDRRARSVRRSTATARASGPYELGIYQGDVRSLLLNRRQRDQFDPAVLEEVRREIRERAAIELAEAVADRLWDGSLSVVR